MPGRHEGEGKGDRMGKKRKPEKTQSDDPLGDLMTAEFADRTFQEAVAEARRKLKEAGRDIFFGKEGKVYAEKPDGTIVLVRDPKNTNG